jgi:hypothetical protein
MTSAESVIERIEEAGGVLALNGQRIRCQLPEDATDLLDELRTHKDEVLLLLLQRERILVMPPSVRLVSWNLKDPPVAIETCTVVTDPILFARTTVEQLRIVLAEPRRWIGWSVPQLIDRLAQVGVVVVLEEANRAQ